MISIVGTLVLVLALWFYRRFKRQRAQAASLPGKKGRVDPFDPNIRDSSMSGDTQLDLLGNNGLRLDTSNTTPSAPGSPIGAGTGYGTATSTSPTNPFSTPIENRHFTYPLGPGPGTGGPSRSSTLDNMSPIGTSTIGRQSSREALLSHGGTLTPTMRSQATARRLALHDGFGEEDEQEEESSDLKRETLAALEGQPATGTSGTSGNNSTNTGRRSAAASRRRQEDVETEYVVHQDAGRVDRVELPPRYDEVQWEERLR